MKRLPGLLAGLTGLGLLLTSCVPIDAAPADPATSSSPEASAVQPHGVTPSPLTDVPLQPYSLDGLEERISTMHRSSLAYELQQGRHPVDYAVPGSEQVLLAERMSSPKRFELPEEQSGDSVLVELTCSTSVSLEFDAFDAEGLPLGSGRSLPCSPDGPHGYGFGSLNDRHVRQVQVVFEGQADIELSVMTFSRSDRD